MKKRGAGAEECDIFRDLGDLIPQMDDNEAILPSRENGPCVAGVYIAGYADQLSGGGNREEEKAHILLAGAVVVQHRIVPAPVYDPIFDQPTPAKDGVLNKMGLLEHEQNVQRPSFGMAAEPLGHFVQRTDPLAGVDGVADAVHPTVRGAEVGIGTEDGKIKKTGASVIGADAPVCDQGLDKLPVDPTAWVVHNLFDFQLIFSHMFAPCFHCVLLPDKEKRPASAFL